MTVLLPDLLYRDDAFHAGLGVVLDSTTGRITRIATERELGNVQVTRLPGRALLPGFVNAHSHAFQRLIRGRMQWRPADDSVANFWSWRQAMYDAALRLSPDDVYDVARYCFVEMLHAGITTVGEFHYLQNAADGKPFADRAELARRVIAAAQDAGIRICLLNTCYAAGGIARPLQSEQRRFETADVDVFIETTERLATQLVDEPLVSVGVAPHSVRAVPREWIRVLHAWAATRDLPFHMHVSEQPAEVAECLAAYGVRPIEMLADDLVLDERFTGIHATHISDGEVGLLGDARATVCACPTTERDLGDGFLRGRDLLEAGAHIALGTDSQTMLDMLEEARLVEYGERLRRLQRVLLTQPAGEDRLDVAPVLLRMATLAGARSLRLRTGMLEEGMLADFCGIDLDHPAIAGWTAETLGASLMFSAPPAVVSDVWVGGRNVVANGRHASYEDAARSFNAIARRAAVTR
jgi:formimidoylglutamate deiminase